MAMAELNIRNRTYTIACAPGREERLTQLAARLERRVVAIAQAVGDIGEERLFLISALSMLEEIDTAASTPPAQPAPDPVAVAEAAAAGDARVATALLDAAARIEAMAQRAEALHRPG